MNSRQLLRGRDEDARRAIVVSRLAGLDFGIYNVDRVSDLRGLRDFLAAGARVARF